MSDPDPTSRIHHQDPEADVHPLIEKRWSPYAFSSKAINEQSLKSLFEAARWSASSYNEQPWRFVVATQSEAEEYAKVLSCLIEFNQSWAKHAPVLVLTFTHENFAKNGKPNFHATHDVGGAAAMLTLEATARGLHVHQMAGIDQDKIKESFELPDGVVPVSAIAIGYAETADHYHDPALRERDETPNTRRPLAETFFTTTWGKAHHITDPKA